MEQTIWQEYQDEDVIVWGINYVEQPEVVEEWIEELGITYPILMDQNGGAYSRYLEIGLCDTPFPLDHVIDPQGFIAYRACEYFPDSMVTVIEDLLEEMGGGGAQLLSDGPTLSQGRNHSPTHTHSQGHMHSQGHNHSLEESGGFPKIELVHPNPIRTAGAINFTLPSSGTVVVDILDVSGRRIRRVLHSPRDAGSHAVVWDGQDSSGQLAPAGIYLVRVSAHGRSSSLKVILVR
jgi:hypothetical protein